MRNRSKKLTAWFFLIIFGIETLFPGMAYALTSGPAQPELKKFEPAGANDLVDLFTGDLKYNIPLVDVGGYPVNLAYGSGEGMEDEATWVGFGWTLNPGTVSRNLRGLPDDFNGDKVTKDYSRKEFKKIGGTIILKPSILAWEKGGVSLKLGVYKDNYYGVGAEVGLSLSHQLALNKFTTLTAGLGVNSDVREGATLSPSLSLERQHDFIEQENVRTISGSFAYNTRAGLKSVSLEASFSPSKESRFIPTMEFSAVKYFGQTYTPTFMTNTANTGFTFGFDIGPSVFGGYLGVGGNGYTYNEKILQKRVTTPAYGYMNYVNGRKNPDVLVDYNREKDGVYIPGIPALPVPIATHDFFMATGQTGSQQFRPFFGGNYVIFDKAHYNTTTNTKAGVTIGAGNAFKAGARIDYTSGNASTNKWVKSNIFLEVGEPGFDVASKPDDESVYFKGSGEHTKSDEEYFTKIGTDKTVQVSINEKNRTAPVIRTFKDFKTREGQYLQIPNPLKREKRDKRTSSISYLTAAQAQKYGLEKTINGDSENNGRITGKRKAHHISEITVADNEGKRMVYGIPVYNWEQQEVSFSIQNPAESDKERIRRNGLITYTPGSENSFFNQKGRANLFSRDILPSYATSFLLTGVLSPDYVDLKNDGITDDDYGSAIKFNYARHVVKVNNQEKPYQWRAPYAANTANYNEGFISDPKDDMASYVYGKKELWYLGSIESKTMIAFFTTSDREDALGVAGENGGQSTTVKQKKLDKITLYSKADWIKNGTNAIPVKVVHFEYDYSIHPGVPNNSGRSVDKNGTDVAAASPDNINKDKGKLSLKRVYFTFGNNTRGQSNPYEFSYDMRKVADVFPSLPVPYNDANNAESKNQYTERQTDRWGTYKPTWYNHLTGSATDGKLNNGEFPYAIQENDDANTNVDYSERNLANLFASKWQLNKIITPTGSTISVQYEADDYGYVQNRRAMQMCYVTGVGNSGGNNTGMIGSPGFTVELPVPAVSTDDFKKKYLQGPDGKPVNNIYYKIYTDIDNRGHYEYVQGYAEIDEANCVITGVGKTAFIALKKISGKHNPVTRASWQMIKNDLPQYAYDNYDNSDVRFGTAAIKSLVQSVINMREIFQPFEKTASNKNFANTIDLSKSMVRLYNPKYNKIGGGSRVKKVTIDDAWYDMSQQTGKTAKYGQEYDYTLKTSDGDIISSGVAAYEPQIGNEENPFHEPVPYTEKVHWAPDKHHFVERPFCESYFPAASVGYSKVTVTNFGDGYAQGGAFDKFTGYNESEFYTAKDFPTLVDNLKLQPTEYENGLLIKLFTSTSIRRVVTSQGFKIELNDMHGKSKSVKVFDKAGDEISSIENFYNVADDNAAEKQLNNYVDILQEGEAGKIQTAMLGTDMDMTTDVRESLSESVGTSIGAYGGMMVLFIWPVPYVAVNFGYNITRNTYNSVSQVKIIHKYGIIKKVRTTKHGSSITAENLLWDGETGGVLLTRTQNEFNDYTYAFNYPAYWAEGHEGMGAAYKNIGAVFTDFNTGTNGVIPTPYIPYVVPGDELVSADGNQKGWVLKSGDNILRFIDADGNILLASGKYYVLRSGRRNLTGAGVGSIVCMNNPVVESGSGKTLQFSVANKILDAKAVLYSNEWGVPVPARNTATTSCVTAIPEVESAGNYLLDNVSAATCHGQFWAGSVGDEGKAIRGFLNFASMGNIPANATILSAALTLHPVEMTGQNASYIKRVTQEVGCSQNQLFWNAQPTVTDSRQAAIPATSSLQPVVVDVSNMFTEWFATKNIPVFSVRISLQNELQPPRTIMGFYGDDIGSPVEKVPVLQVCYKVFKECDDPVNKVLNPYVQGISGNWRPKQNFVYTVNREQKPGLPSLVGGTNIRTSGAYTLFNPFWTFQPGSLHTPVNPADVNERWIWANKSVYFDEKGNEVENVSPLNRDRLGNIIDPSSLDPSSGAPYRFSSALFGYRQSVATAVATNARRNEIAFDGFEDYDFYLGGANATCPSPRHFDWGLSSQSGGSWCSTSGCLATDKVHTGKYSFKLTNGVTITKQAGNATPPSVSMLTYDNMGRAMLTSNEMANGFAPISGKKYLLSMWVYDGNLQSNKISGLTVSINGQDQQVSNIVVPVVEGWKRLDLTFTGTSSFSLSMSPSNTYIDDVRILPFDGQLNSFVFDDRTMRLMAQLDENNFASFYEYDDEGTPIRVKKETERGIMTLKENRQSLRQR